MTPTSCSFVLRLYTMTISALYAYTGLMQKKTLVYETAHSDQLGVMALIVLGVLACLGLIDAIVNDALSDRYVIQSALNYRHLVSMGMAGSFAVLMWLVVKNNLPMAMFPFYAIYTVLIPAAAFSDVRTRYKLKVCP